MDDIRICRVILCNRHAQKDSNLCAAHFKQIVDKALGAASRFEITESEARVMDGNR